MARNGNVALAKNDWTELTNAENATDITFQNQSGRKMLVKGTANGTKPTTSDGSITYQHGEGERKVALADLFPGITCVRLWAFVDMDGGSAFVSYA